MKQILPEGEFDAFRAAIEEPPVRAFRVNTVKTSAEVLLPLLPFPARPVPFLSTAYYATEDKVGATPWHHAGMLYMQDPSAISAVAALPVNKGMRVLDLCAAPGGKTTQLGAAIGREGVLVSNEYVPARCRILQGNVERMGLSNTIVTNLTSGAVADFFGPVFDLVVTDAPCSGEGMLRKYEVAGEEWSEENVTLCAARQKEILDNAARAVKDGGLLLYSTCTFSLEENECVIADFLSRHPEFSLCPVAPAVAAVTANGIRVNGLDLSLCRRFYPHRSPGEGQFLALLAKGEGNTPRRGAPDGAKPLSKADEATVRTFLEETMTEMPKGRLTLLRDTVFLAPDFPIPATGVFAAGVAIGTVTKGRVVPHHHLFSALGPLFRERIFLTKDDPRVGAYLSGEEIAVSDLTSGSGFAAVFYEGAALGGGKISSGKLKNYYPKGLRNRP